MCCTGVVQTAADSKLMQLQTSGLATLKQILSALKGKVALSITVTNNARQQLVSLTTDNWSSDIKEMAEEVLTLLQAFMTDTDVSMSET